MTFHFKGRLEDFHLVGASKLDFVVKQVFDFSVGFFESISVVSDEPPSELGVELFTHGDCLI